MRLIKYKDKKGAVNHAWLIDDMVGKIEGDVFGEFSREEANIPLKSLELLPPVSPSKIICAGRNYAAHAEEHDAEVPEVPLIFLKPPSAIIADGEEILLPPQSNQVEHEAELVLVIGKRGRWIQPENAKQHILGYLIGNDVTARDLQRRDGQWTRGKGFDTFCPVGKWIETEFDPSDAVISCYVNEELRQVASTRDMVFTVPQLLVYISSVMTLEPGDLVFTGTPSGVGMLEDGDVVRVSIEGLGELTNPVVSQTVSKDT